MHLIHRSSAIRNDGIVELRVTTVQDNLITETRTYLVDKHTAEMFHEYYKMGNSVHETAFQLLKTKEKSYA